MTKRLLPTFLSMALLVSLGAQMLRPLPSDAKKNKGDTAATAQDAKSATSQTGELTVKIVTLSSPVKAGSEATATVTTAPNAMCDITVKYKSGPASASGLKSQRADNTGKASWTWKVAKNCAAGEWPVEVNVSLKGKKASAGGTLKVEK